MKPLLLIAMAASALVAQQQPWEVAAGGKMSFEVASVKPTTADAFHPPAFPLDTGDASPATGGRFQAVFPLPVYIQFAYKLHITAEQAAAVAASLPKALRTDMYEIDARSSNPNATKDQFRLMMQALLADRFKLAVHFETQTVAAFAMTLAKPGKTGPQLQRHREGTPCTAPVAGRAKPAAGTCGVYYVLKSREGMHAESHNMTTDVLADSLPLMGDLGRLVVNQTGLTGNFDFSLDWAPGSLAPQDADAPRGGPDFFTAIREQLGLKLEPGKAQVRMIAIDHVERPTAN